MTSNATRARPPVEGPRQLLTRAAVRTLLRSPRTFLANLRQGPEFVRDRRREADPESFWSDFREEGEAVAVVTGAEPAAARAAMASLWLPEADPDEPLNVWNARGELLRIAGAIVALERPQVMVETGVAQGFTTATLLAAMERNGSGHLYSIDLPALQFDPSGEVGRAVPATLRARWTLELGDSRRLLGPLCARVAPLDVFLHDALHTYSSQLREYRTVWPHLREGGLLLSDDVGNPAFVEFAAAVGRVPVLVRGSNRRSAIGLLRK